MRSEELQQVISRIYDTFRDDNGQGKVADYIPALGKANPADFSVSVTTLEGETLSAGDHNKRFTVQSISKVLTLAMLNRLTGEEVWSSVGKEPSGTSFNSLIQLEREKGIPRNPFINAGALVVTDRIIDSTDTPKRRILDFVRELCGCEDIFFNSEVARSELSVSYRNLALCNFMKSFGNIHNDPEQILDVYTHQCSLSMNTDELSRAFMFLVNGGKSMSDTRVCSLKSAKRINSLMLTCGLYNESGEFAYRVGLPGKSGVGGGIVAIVPGELVIAVYSPSLNANGNSHRGIEALEMFANETRLSVF